MEAFDDDGTQAGDDRAEAFHDDGTQARHNEPQSHRWHPGLLDPQTRNDEPQTVHREAKPQPLIRTSASRTDAVADQWRRRWRRLPRTSLDLRRLE